MNQYRKDCDMAAKAVDVAIAVACPADNDQIKFTNNHWSFSKSEIASEYGFNEFVVMNDFEAVARSLILVDHEKVLKVGTGQIKKGDAKSCYRPWYRPRNG